MNNILFKVLLLKGESGNSIESITKTDTEGLVDTYTVRLTDGSTTTFEVTNGADGANGRGITSITKTATAGLVDTYTIAYTDNTTSTFTVNNGKGITNIAKTATAGLVDTYTITYNDGTTSTFTVTNGQDGTGDLTTATQTGNPISITTDIAQVARDTKITFEPIQASGTPTPSSPIPIYGYDSVDLTGCGKNLFNKNDPNAILDNTNIDTGSRIISTAVTTKSICIRCKGNTTYTITKILSARFILAYTDTMPENGVPIYNLVTTSTTVANITTGADAKYLVVYLYKSDIDTVTFEQIIASVQIEEGATATAYEAYIASTDISLPLPSTVYGGELDVESGVLRVTHKQVDMGDLNWDIWNNRFVVYHITDMVVKGAGEYSISKCSCFTVKSNGTSSSYSGEDHIIYAETNTDAVYVAESGYLDATAFKTAVTGQKLVYELATPIEIQLTPYEVELLQGANVITTNGTSITITYRNGTIATLEDTPAETVNKLADLMAENKGDIADVASDLATLDGKAVKQTSGTLDAQLKANQTAMANLGTAQIRDVVISDTAPTIGGASPYPNGIIMLVYQ